MWETIKYIGSGITLAAFIIAVAAWIYRLKILERGRLIQLAPENDRRELVEQTLEFFDIDTGGLTREQKYDLVLQQIRAKATRFKITATVIVIIAFLTAGITFFAIYEVPNSNSNNSNNNRPLAEETPAANINLTSANNRPLPQNTSTPTLTNKNQPPANLPNPITVNQNAAQATTPNILPRISKLYGDNVTIPVGKSAEFAIRVTDTNGNSIEGAKVAWRTDNSPNIFVNVTDKDGVSKASNMPMPNSWVGAHEQTAVIVTKNTERGFNQENQIESIGQPVKFTFRFIKQSTYTFNVNQK